MAGAVETMYAESAQALFCAIADIAGKQKTKKILDVNLFPSYNEFKRSNKKIIEEAYNYVDTPGATLKGIEEFLQRPSDKNEWYRSSTLIAVKLMNDLDTPYLVVHQYDKRWDEFKKTVEKIQKKLN